MDKGIREGVYTSNYYINHCTGKSDDPDFHLHDNAEIYLSVSGGDNFIINDRIYDIRQGDLFIIGNYDIHKATYRHNEDYERYYMQFDLGFLSEFVTAKTNLQKFFNEFFERSINKIKLSEKENKELIELFKKALNNDATYGRDLHEQICFIEILLYISQLCTKSDDYYVDYYTKENIPIIDKLFDYVNNNITEDLSLELLAKEIHVSKSHMSKVFKRHTGTTINKYIVARRIAEAKKLLKTSDNVNYVCDKVGFNDYTHFIRTFTKKVGISPLQYAKNSESIL